MSVQITSPGLNVDQRDMRASRRHPLGNFGLSIVLAFLFVASWAGQLVTQMLEVSNEAATHGQEFRWDQFWPAFGQATFENWQSEFLQLFTFVVLATYLVHRGSPQSRDGDDDLRSQVQRIEDRLDGVHFQLFEERAPRTKAETYFDERRQDRDYDQAYRQTWRALRSVIEDEEDEGADGPESPLSGP